MSRLDRLSRYTAVVADTADIDVIKTYRPQDATTNPTLILKNASGVSFSSLVIPDGGRELLQTGFTEEDMLYVEAAVMMGNEILQYIPGRVSTEVPARYSFDSEKTMVLARYIIDRYRERGVDGRRVLIKIASTWEGIEAARVLEKEGIHCNMTLLFSLPQALACAQAGVTLISPFVGRVCDWYQSRKEGAPEHDPGVELVRDIYLHFKKYDYPVEIMGASFRTLKQVLALVGCDFLTISPALLEELGNYSGEIIPCLTVEAAKTFSGEVTSLDRQAFLWEICQNPMATEKLAEGIRLFHQDFLKLNQLLKK